MRLITARMPASDASSSCFSARSKRASPSLRASRSMLTAPTLQRGDLRLQVAPQQFRLAHVLQDDGADRLDQLAGLEQLDRRDAQAFLEDLGGARAVAAGRGAADIQVMAQRADEADAPALVEHGLVGDDVGQVLAAAVGIVGDDDIVRLPLIGRDVPRQDLGEEVAHRVEVARNAGGLRHVPARRGRRSPWSSRAARARWSSGWCATP